MIWKLRLAYRITLLACSTVRGDVLHNLFGGQEVQVRYRLLFATSSGVLDSNVSEKAELIESKSHRVELRFGALCFATNLPC